MCLCFSDLQAQVHTGILDQQNRGSPQTHTRVKSARALGFSLLSILPAPEQALWKELEHVEDGGWRGCLLTACENWATSIAFCLTYRTLKAKTTSLPVEGCGGTVTSDRSPKLSDSHSMVLSNFHSVLSLYSCQDVPLGMWPLMV